MVDPRRRRVTVRLERGLERDALDALCARTERWLRFRHARCLHCDVEVGEPDRWLLQSVARLVLVTRRHGAVLVLVDPPDHLQAALDLAGLADHVAGLPLRARGGAGARTSGTGCRSPGRS